MTKAAVEVSKEFPRTVFHADGVKNLRVETEEEFNRLIMTQGVWFTEPQPAPEPPPEPMTPEEAAAMTASELQGLGDQVDAQGQVMGSLESRVEKLEEKLQIARVAFETLAERIAVLERKDRKGTINDGSR